MLTEIVIPDLPPESFCKYMRVSPRSVMEEPIVTVAAVSVPDGAAKLRELRLALGAVASKPFRVREVEELFTKETLNDESIKRAASIAGEVSNPIDDMHGPADWKRELVEVHVHRVLKNVQKHYSREGVK
jgi:carbon-monoxide dehydrogenase medium subunit